MAAAFRTPGGSVSAAGRKAAEKKGQTMPGGSFPIRNADDLDNAKHLVGQAKNPQAARAWINKRARALGEPGLGQAASNGNGGNGNGNSPPRTGSGGGKAKNGNGNGRNGGANGRLARVLERRLDARDRR